MCLPKKAIVFILAQCYRKQFLKTKNIITKRQISFNYPVCSKTILSAKNTLEQKAIFIQPIHIINSIYYSYLRGPARNIFLRGIC